MPRSMFHPLSLFVGLRYVRARSHKFFVSFITWVSVMGVCVGVAALIVILSVMNGFEGELRDRLLALSAHARLLPVGEEPADLEALAAAASEVPGVTGAAPYVEVQALALRSPEMLPVALRGIDPAREGAVTDIARAVTVGALADLAPGTNRANRLESERGRNSDRGLRRAGARRRRNRRSPACSAGAGRSRS
ncbi:MAG TPA: ABC transporter permease, partial [Steroidobacteraceae bacterium]|nr:ABC transporter permease [Steroidobacteraceae bacterium]